MYLNQFKLLFDELLSTDNPRSCTEVEVESLENSLKIKLPSAYKEFLMWGGHYAGRVFRGSDYQFELQQELQYWAKELLSENGLEGILPPISYVFLIHQGYTFLYFSSLIENDPNVYQYEEGEIFGKFIGKFSDLLIKEVFYTPRGK